MSYICNFQTIILVWICPYWILCLVSNIVVDAVSSNDRICDCKWWSGLAPVNLVKSKNGSGMLLKVDLFLMVYGDNSDALLLSGLRLDPMLVLLLWARSRPRWTDFVIILTFGTIRSIFFNTGYCVGPTVGCLSLRLNVLNRNPTFQIPYQISF